MKSVESIFLEYESKTDPFSEAEISDRLRQLAEQQPKTNEEFAFRAESLAFLFAKNAGINNYYGPYFKCKHDDGSIFENPSISDLTPEILEYWQDRCKHAQHPALRLRYSDLVWDLTKSVTGSGADVKFAQEAIDQTIALCSRAIPFKFPAVEGKIALSRGLNIAMQISDTQRITALINKIIEFESLHAVDQQLGTWGFSYDLLVDDKKVSKLLSTEQTNLIIERLNERFVRLKSASNNIFGLHQAAQRLADYYLNKHIPRQTQQVEEVLSVYGEEVLVAAKKVSPMVAEAWLKEALHIFQKFGLGKSFKQKILRAIQELPPEDLRIVEAKTTISAAEYQKYAEEFVKGSLSSALETMAISFLPQKEQAAHTVQELFKQYPLTLLIGINKPDKQGRTLARVKPIAEDLDSHVLLQMSQDIAILTVFLNDILKNVISTFNVHVDELIDHFFSKKLFCISQISKRKNALAKGLNFFLNKDFFSAAHILIPQIEHILRTLVELQGGVTYRLDQNGGFQLLTLGAILEKDELKNAFDDNLLTYFKLLLTSPLGWNIRNNVCHGLIELEEITESIVNRLFQVLLLLSLLQFEEHKVEHLH